MLASFTAGVEYQRGDLDQDGIVNIHDVTFLMNYLLEGTWPDEPVTPPDNHEWVDLGLPSGTLWATCNVGANAPEEYGDHFAWGETSPKEVYNWSTYQWCNGSMFTLTKYNTQSSLGMVDNKTELDPEDDAASVNWGPSWRTPTTDQQKELIDKCSWARTTQNGVHGFRVTGPNGNSLFLPAAGYTTRRYVKLLRRIVDAPFFVSPARSSRRQEGVLLQGHPRPWPVAKPRTLWVPAHKVQFRIGVVLVRGWYPAGEVGAARVSCHLHALPLWTKKLSTSAAHPWATPLSSLPCWVVPPPKTRQSAEPPASSSSSPLRGTASPCLSIPTRYSSTPPPW